MVDSWQNATAKDTGQVFLLVTLLVILFLVPLVRIVSVKKLGALLVSDKRVERSKSGLLLRQMTPIGRFTLMSQTERNPSIISFFIALANQRGTKGVELEEFEKLWRTCIMNKHERFRCCVSDTGTTCCFKVLERPFGDYCKVLPHPYDSEEFKARVSNFLTSPMDIKTKLWECTMSTGDIGSSGAIITDKPRENSYNESETIFLFRNHHVLCDGVSLSTVVSDASDEREELNDALQSALDKQTSLMKRAGLISRLLTWLMYYIVGSIYALSVQFWNMITSSNPFDIFAIGSRMQERKRSVAWRYLASVQEAKSTLKANSRLSKHATLNDLFVSILSRALEKQYQVLQNSSSPKQTQPTVNIVCPVHLSGGVGPPGRCIGNSIGAFVTTVPFRPNNPFSSTSRLCRVSQNLNKVKHTPAAKISWAVSSFISTFAPESVAKFALVYANCHAVAAISNVHGFPKKIHWMGRPVEILCAFLPLPSGIPIGIVVTSYNGKIIISLDADEGIVPDADKFLDFMIEEYQALKTESDLPSPE